MGAETKFLSLNTKENSLYALIADGQYRATSIGRDAWKSLVSGSSLQPNCNKEGFNARQNDAFSKVRIGITTNEQNECNSNDSRLGFGGGGSPGENSCGNVAASGGDNGDKNVKAFGYVIVQ